MMVDATTQRQRGNRTPVRRATAPGRGAAAVSGMGGSGVQYVQRFQGPDHYERYQGDCP
jgi:hypothetical protein